MANNNMAWNETARMGNPTCSHQMARLIKHTKRIQTQRWGMAPQAQRPMTNGEFEKIQESNSQTGKKANARQHLIRINDSKGQVMSWGNTFLNLWLQIVVPNWF